MTPTNDAAPAGRTAEAGSAVRENVATPMIARIPSKSRLSGWDWYALENLAELKAEADRQEQLSEPPPWLIVTEDFDSAELLRDLGRRAVALEERTFRHELMRVPRSDHVLLVGPYAQRLRPELATTFRFTWFAHVPLGFLTIAEQLSRLQARFAPVTSDELLEIGWRPIEAGAALIGGEND